MMNVQSRESAKKIPLKPNKWVIRRLEARKACHKFTDEEIRLYECRTLASWESR